MLDETFSGNEKQYTLEEKDTITTSNDVVEHALYSCTLCEFDTEEESQMKIHEKGHEDNQCSCKFGATDVCVLKEHDSACRIVNENKDKSEATILPIVAEDEDSELPTNLHGSVVICENCGNGFGNMECFNEHKKTCHDEIQSFECEVGKLKFQTSSDFESHKEAEHGGKS